MKINKPHQLLSEINFLVFHSNKIVTAFLNASGKHSWSDSKTDMLK